MIVTIIIACMIALIVVIGIHIRASNKAKLQQSEQAKQGVQTNKEAQQNGNEPEPCAKCGGYVRRGSLIRGMCPSCVHNPTLPPAMTLSNIQRPTINQHRNTGTKFPSQLRNIDVWRALTNEYHRDSNVHVDLSLLNGCAAYVNKSADLEVVIHQYEQLLIILGRLSGYENSRAYKFTGEPPSAALARIRREKPEIMTLAVKRAFAHMIKDAKVLKTERGRENRKIKLFELLRDLAEYFPPETNEYVEELIRKNTKEVVVPEVVSVEPVEVRLAKIRAEHENITQELAAMDCAMWATENKQKRDDLDNKSRSLHKRLVALEEDEYLLMMQQPG